MQIRRNRSFCKDESKYLLYIKKVKTDIQKLFKIPVFKGRLIFYLNNISNLDHDKKKIIVIAILLNQKCPGKELKN